MTSAVDGLPPSTDVLSHGRDRQRRQIPRWVLAVIAVSIALGTLGWYADGALRERSLAEIDRELQASLGAVLASQRQVVAMVEYTGSRRLALDTPPDIRAGLQALVDEAIADADDEVAEARERILRIRVLPWQSDVAAARDAALALL